MIQDHVRKVQKHDEIQCGLANRTDKTQGKEFTKYLLTLSSNLNFLIKSCLIKILEIPSKTNELIEDHDSKEVEKDVEN